MNSIKLRLPFPPSLNATYRWGRGNWYKTKAATDYTWMVKQAFLTKQIRGFEADKPLKLTVNAYPADKRKHDVDNILKVLMDSLQTAKVYDNDCQVKILHVEMTMFAPKGESSFVDIVLEEI